MARGYFDDVVSGDDIPVKNLCNLCRGSRLLCGRSRCPLMERDYGRRKSRGITESTDLAGSSPPAVFVGRVGYPKVDIGPMVPGMYGDTYDMDRPELWKGRSIGDIIDMRSGLVRGKYRIDATDPASGGRIVSKVQDLALTERPVDVEARFEHKPRARVTLDDEVQPFGPSARLERMRKANGKWEQNLEKGYYDTDMTAVDAVLQAYNSGSYISDIQKAFSVGVFGQQANRRFVPTRWSITAVDDIIGKDYLTRTRWYPPIDDYRVYYYEELDNRWAVILMPTTWRFELIEAFYPGSSWNPFGKEVQIASSHEFYRPRTDYAEIGGCYYASRMAVNELLEREKRTAGAVICREALPAFSVSIGVWTVREHVRAALRTEPFRFDTMDNAFRFIDSRMDIKKDGWVKSSSVLTDFYTQRRIEDYYGRSAQTLEDEVSGKDGGEKVSADILDSMNIGEEPR